MIRICDIMHKGVIFCYEDDTVIEVARILDENNIRGVVVIDEAGNAVGHISNIDLLNYYYSKTRRLKAGEIMKKYKIEVDSTWPIDKAIEIMIKNKFEHLIIVDPHAGPKMPVAILTSYDIVKYMSGLNLGKHEYVLKMLD